MPLSMIDAKITLSTEELSAIRNTDFFRIKSDVFDTVRKTMGHLNNELKSVSLSHTQVPAVVFENSGKISRGENYKGLPYMILDYPRIFKRHDVFAFRSMFWWGNHFAFTLHLSGTYFERYKESIVASANELARKPTLIPAIADQWDHTLSSTAVVDLGGYDTDAKEVMTNSMDQHGFAKLSRKLALDEAASLMPFALETYDDFMKALRL